MASSPPASAHACTHAFMNAPSTRPTSCQSFYLSRLLAMTSGSLHFEWNLSVIHATKICSREQWTRTLYRFDVLAGAFTIVPRISFANCSCADSIPYRLGFSCISPHPFVGTIFMKVHFIYF